jgi:quercetin dioxygenase-like cupin family protein
MTDNGEKITSIIFDPPELIDYQDGAIVSRTLINKPTGTITIFAFDKGQELSTHSAPFDAMVQVVDGEGLIVISEVEYRLKAGQMIIMPANEPHAVKAETRFKMLLSMVKS